MDELSAEEAVAFGRAVAARRAELGLTRKDVASRSGLSYPYVSNIESGHKQPSAKALHALACALELRPAELLERSDSLARLAQTASAARFGEDGSAPAGSWFRGELGLAAPRPAAASRADRDEEMRSLIRDVVREELGRDREAIGSAASVLSGLSPPTMGIRPAEAPPEASPPHQSRPPRLPPAIRAQLPDWLTEPAGSAAELAVQSVALERLHRLPSDANPDEVQQVINDALEHLIKEARRRRRRPPPTAKGTSRSLE